MGPCDRQARERTTARFFGVSKEAPRAAHAPLGVEARAIGTPGQREAPQATSCVSSCQRVARVVAVIQRELRPTTQLPLPSATLSLIEQNLARDFPLAST